MPPPMITTSAVRCMGVLGQVLGSAEDHQLVARGVPTRWPQHQPRDRFDLPVHELDQARLGHRQQVVRVVARS